MDDDLSLAGDLPLPTREDWLKLLTATLKGQPFEKLIAKTYDEVRIEPLLEREPNARPLAARAPHAGWQVIQRVDHPEPAAANAEALHDLENGANGLMLVFAGAIGCHGFGVSAAALDRVLERVELDAGIAIELDAGPQAIDAADRLSQLVKKRGLSPAAVDIRFGLDPLGIATANGAAPWRELTSPLARAVGDLAGQGFNGPFAVADARTVHAAGGSEAQELAFALSVAVIYLRALEAHGVALEQARHMIFFRLAADADQFLTMAKFRALRKLWARIEEACGLAPRAAFVSAETAWRMMTRRDPWVNTLRATTAVFAAALGGANSIAVLPFTAALGLPDRFARRIARNSQLILLEESNLAKVTDPAAGSGAIESLTDQLARAGWALFQAIEAVGGAGAALEQGFIQDKVAKVRAARAEKVAHRAEPLTGTSEFPDLSEAPVAVLDVAPVLFPPSPVAAIAPLPRIRLAEQFEHLRDASDCMLAKTGERPKIFLANLGRLSDFSARASFARNFFAAGGIEAVTNEGFANHAAMAQAFTASGARLACLCASDEVYVREAVDAAKALSAAGSRHIYIAGRPSRTGTMPDVAGSSIFVGCDALGILTAAHRFLADQ